MPERPRRATVAIGLSIASFLLVALVASVPGSPYTPVLPAPPAGPFAWVASIVGLDGVHGSALVAIGVAAVAFAAGAFLLVLRAAWRGSLSASSVLVLAVVYHLALVLLPLLFSRDVYSYAAYGKIAATYHANPYVVTPADFPGDPLAPFVGPKWFDTPAVYGPLWTQLSALVTRAFDSVEAQVVAFRAIAIAASLATTFVVWRVARERWPERAAFAVAAFGANPVVLFQSAASGHNDLLLALGIIVGVAFAFARRYLWATVILALATLIKATAAIPLALFVIAAVASAPREDRARTAVRHLAVAATLAIVAAFPFLNTDDPTLGMVELATHEGWLAPSRLFRRLFEAVGGDALSLLPRIVFPVLLVVVLVELARRIARAGATPWRIGAASGWGLIALMLLGPVLLPWYVVWALPVAWLVPPVPRLVLLGTSVALTLSQWTSDPAGFATAYDANILFGHYVLTPLIVGLLGWVLFDLRRRSRAGAPLEERPRAETADHGDR